MSSAGDALLVLQSPSLYPSGQALWSRSCCFHRHHCSRFVDPGARGQPAVHCAIRPRVGHGLFDPSQLFAGVSTGRPCSPNGCHVPGRSGRRGPTCSLLFRARRLHARANGEVLHQGRLASVSIMNEHSVYEGRPREQHGCLHGAVPGGRVSPTPRGPPVHRSAGRGPTADLAPARGGRRPTSRHRSGRAGDPRPGLATHPQFRSRPHSPDRHDGPGGTRQWGDAARAPRSRLRQPGLQAAPGTPRQRHRGRPSLHPTCEASATRRFGHIDRPRSLCRRRLRARQRRWSACRGRIRRAGPVDRGVGGRDLVPERSGC